MYHFFKKSFLNITSFLKKCSTEIEDKFDMGKTHVFHWQNLAVMDKINNCLNRKAKIDKNVYIIHNNNSRWFWQCNLYVSEEVFQTQLWRIRAKL